MQSRLRSAWLNWVTADLGTEAAFRLSEMRSALQELLDLNDERNALDSEMSDSHYWARSSFSKAELQARINEHNRKVVAAWRNVRIILSGIKYEEQDGG